MCFKIAFLLLVLIFGFPGFSIRPVGDCVVGFDDKYGEFYNRSEHSLDVGEMFRWNFQEGRISGENSFFFGSSSIMGRIIKKINDDTALVQIINAKGELQETELRISSESGIGSGSVIGGKEIYHIGQGSSQLEEVFTSVKSNKRRLSFISKEHQKQSQALKAKGFKESDYQGIDEVHTMIVLKEQFRKQEVNPYKTHIDYFANKVEDHINYIKETIPPSKQRALERLEEHARSIIQKKGVTYHWWIRFNYALSRLFDRTEEDIAEGSSIWEKKESIAELIALFPSVVLVPVKGETGIMAINAGSFRGVYVLGLMRENMEVEGVFMSPSGFFTHDLGHTRTMSEYFNTRYDSMNYREFYGQLMDKIRALPFEKRKYAELAYFILTHEAEVFISSREYYARNYLENIEYNMAGSFYNRSDLSFELKTEGIVELMIDIIIEAVTQIQGAPPPKKRPWN